jgi:uncharacterized MAPEG superfamily protein
MTLPKRMCRAKFTILPVRVRAVVLRGLPDCTLSSTSVKKMLFAFWCVLIAGLLPVLTVSVAKFGRSDFDNSEPRAWMEKQTGRRRRADSAHQNHFEAFPFFACAVIVAHLLAAPALVVNALAGLFIIVRIAYTLFYLADKPSLRSNAWGIGYLCVIGIFLVALVRL